MKYIKGQKGEMILGFDDEMLYFNTMEPDEEGAFNESVAFSVLDEDNNGALKIITILALQEELGLISDNLAILNQIINQIPALSLVVQKQQEWIDALNQRIVLLEMATVGPASSFINYIYLMEEKKAFSLTSSLKPCLSASEVIGNYGLSANEYWEGIQANGEFIESETALIHNGKELYEGILLLLDPESRRHIDQKVIDEKDIDWEYVIRALMANRATQKMGIELRESIPIS